MDLALRSSCIGPTQITPLKPKQETQGGIFFRKLPLEMRVMVYNMAMPGPRAVRAQMSAVSDRRHVYTSAPIPTPLLHLCIESRLRDSQNPPCTFELLFVCGANNAIVERDECSTRPHPFFDAINYLGSLETLFIVPTRNAMVASWAPLSNFVTISEKFEWQGSRSLEAYAAFIKTMYLSEKLRESTIDEIKRANYVEQIEEEDENDGGEDDEEDNDDQDSEEDGADRMKRSRMGLKIEDEEMEDE